MNATHDLETLNGVNPRTARKLFALLAQEWDGVSWFDFYRFSGGNRLACFRKASRWIPGDYFREYFAERGARAGNAFVRLYSEKAHKPSMSAYDESNSARKGNGDALPDTRAALLSALNSVSEEIASKGTNEKRTESINAIAKAIVALQ